MEKLSSQVLITDQSLQSQLTTKLLYTDALKESSNQCVESSVKKYTSTKSSVTFQSSLNFHKISMWANNRTVVTMALGEGEEILRLVQVNNN